MGRENVTLAGRRLIQLSRMPRGWRSYEMSDELFALKGIAAATTDGDLLGKGMIREVKHRDNTRSYVLTAKGKETVVALEAKLNS
jgi:hypothetical protein